MQTIGKVLESTNLLAEEGQIQSLWDTFSEAFSYEQKDKNEDDDFLDLVLTSIKTTFIDGLFLANDACDTLIDELVDVFKDIQKAGIANDLTIFISALLSSLQNEYPFNKKICTNIHINEKNQGAIMSTIERNKLLSILVAHDSIPVDELEPFLDGRIASLVPLTRSIIVDTRQFGDPWEEPSGVTTQPLSLQQFGTDLDKIIYWATQFLLYDNDSLPDDLSIIKNAVFPLDRFCEELTFQKGTFVINTINYRVLCATLRYISDTTLMWVNDCIWVLNKKLSELVEIRKHMNYLVSVDVAYVVLLLLLLRALKIHGTSNDYQTARTRLKAGLIQFERRVTTAANMDLPLFTDLLHKEQYRELRSYINEEEHRRISSNQGASTVGENNVPTIESIYAETGYFRETPEIVALFEGRTVGGNIASAALSSQRMVEQAVGEKQFVKLASTLRVALNEALLFGDASKVAIVLEAMRSLRSEFAPILEASKASSEASTLAENLGVYECTYEAYLNPKDTVTMEQANIMIARFKKLIRD